MRNEQEYHALRMRNEREYKALRINKDSVSSFINGDLTTY